MYRFHAHLPGSGPDARDAFDIRSTRHPSIHRLNGRSARCFSFLVCLLIISKLIDEQIFCCNSLTTSSSWFGSRKGKIFVCIGTAKEMKSSCEEEFKGTGFGPKILVLLFSSPRTRNYNPAQIHTYVDSVSIPTLASS